MSNPFDDVPPPTDEGAPAPDAPEEPVTLPGGRVDPETGEVRDDDTNAEPGGDAPTLEERVENLEEAVADIAELLRLAPGGPWVWHKLKPKARRKLAEQLVEWVEWLSNRYLANMSQEYVFKLPPRWFTNPVVVELMTALYVGYISVYSSRQRIPSMALIEWHERGLWPTLQRIKDLHLVSKDGRLSDARYPVITDEDAITFLGGPAKPQGEG